MEAPWPIRLGWVRIVELTLGLLFVVAGFVKLSGMGFMVELFKQESENGNDAQLKAAAAKALPIIEHHYQMAQQLAKAKA